jgi:hypothetical protein
VIVTRINSGHFSRLAPLPAQDACLAVIYRDIIDRDLHDPCPAHQLPLLPEADDRKTPGPHFPTISRRQKEDLGLQTVQQHIWSFI